MHPLMHDYFEVDSNFFEIITTYEKNPLYEKDPLINILKPLYLAPRKPPEQARQIFKQAEAVKWETADKDLALLFISTWLHSARLLNRERECTSLLKLAKSLLTDTTHSSLRAAIEINSIDFSQFKSRASLDAHYEQILLKYHRDSKRNCRMLRSHLKSLAMNGTLKEIDDLSLKNLQEDTSIFNSLYFVNNIEIGELQEAWHFHDLLKHGSPLNKSTILTLRQFKAYSMLLLLLTKKEHFDEKIIQELEAGPIWKKNLMAILYLFRRQEKRALLEHQPFGSFETNGFLDMIIYKVQLANKNVRNVLKALSGTRNTCFESYANDFFWARLEMLRGNRSEAVKYFTRARLAFERYGASARFNIELDLATELTASDIMFLASESSKLIEKGTKEFDFVVPQEKTPELKGVERIIGMSEKVTELKKTIVTFSSSDVPILIIGETGTGKEVIARAIHEESNRKDSPYLTINCGAIADSLLQSELFGHTAGAFTGATKKHDGIFLTAEKGTVFLDEFGEMSPMLQVALLRVLETNEVQPIGNAKTIPIHCRIIVATNAPLEEMIATGKFRKDLYYRIKRLTIEVPPLRERVSDIPLLIKHFFSLTGYESKKTFLADDLKEAMEAYQWPGNVRELRNEMERIQLLNSEKETYELKDSAFLSKMFASPKTPKTQNLVQDEHHENTEPKSREAENLREFSRLPAWRRQEMIVKELEAHGRLTRSEIASMFKISRETASLDLRKLVESKRIKQVSPTPSPRTNYFVPIRDNDIDKPSDF